MKQLFKPIRGDFCTKCNTSRIIECYNRYDKPINYTYFLDQLEKGRTDILANFDKIEINSMCCKKCNEVYFIDWRKGYPLPIRDFIIVDIFLQHTYN